MTDNEKPDTTNEAQALEERGGNRSRTPNSDAFKQYISTQWAEPTAPNLMVDVVAPFAETRRRAVSERFAGTVLVFAAGDLKTRSNDTDYRFRAHSAFAHLTGWGSASVPGSVLLFAPTGSSTGSHDVTLYFREPAGKDSDEFYTNPTIGEFWTGRRPSLAEVGASLGIAVKGLSHFAGDLKNALAGGSNFAAIDADDQAITGILAATTKRDEKLDAALVEFSSELRLVKDEYEVRQMRDAVRASIDGFQKVVAELPRAVAHERGERVVEGVFFANAREQGNDLGYETIAAAGQHACTLHWIQNDGPVPADGLLLLDAGVEVDSYYTADVTRTLPVSGKFSAVQRRVYEAVLAAADAAFEVAVPGNLFRDVHDAALRVIAKFTSDWGLLPITYEETIKPDAQLHRRYMVHGTSHHLGMDVHDCAQARREMYLDGVIKPGMIFTIEPGLYFQPGDLTVPAELRGIGVRIEDDVLITATGNENLTAAIPRTATELEAWMARYLPTASPTN